MSFLALATLLSVSTLEHTLLTQVNALDDWRSSLGFLQEQSITSAPSPSSSPSATPKPGEENAYVVTATNAEALNQLDRDYELTRLTDVTAVFTSLDGLDESDERVIEITEDTSAEFAELNEGDDLNQAQAAIYSAGDPLRVKQWALDQIGVDEGTPRGTSSQKIAIIDSGIWTDHPDLKGQIVQQFHTGEKRVVSGPVQHDVCRRSHGTLVAGVLAGAGFNGVGGRGISPNARLISIDATSQDDCSIGPRMSSTVLAIDLATDLKVDTIVMPYGFRLGNCQYALQQAIDRAKAAGITIVASSGNYFGSASRHVPETPASCDGVISVAATQRGGQVTSYSTRNPWVDVAAPGGTNGGSGSSDAAEHAVLTTNWPNATETTSELYRAVAGTSFSAPHVAGLATLIRQVRPSTTPDEIEAIIEQTAERSSDVHRSTVGWGEVNVSKALQLASEPKAIPDPAFNIPHPVGEHAIRQATGMPQPLSRVGGQVQDAISQGVAFSQHTFIDQGVDPKSERRGQAQWAVLARHDLHADALAGASLTLGVGPLLYTTPTLAEATAKELMRTLKPHATVYLLGGPNALPATMEDEIKKLGFTPVRLGGTTRIETSVAIAQEVHHRVSMVSQTAVPISLITASDAWADSIGAGYLGATAGLPVLLNPTNELHPAVQETIQGDEGVIMVGGNQRISTHVQAQLSATRKPEHVIRLAGPDRFHTMVMTSARLERMRSRPVEGVDVINLADRESWASALAATVPTTAFGHLPVAVGQDHIAKDVQTYITGVGKPITIWGPEQVVNDQVATTVRQRVSTNPNTLNQ